MKTYLDAFGAILLEGPKWCGKTTSAGQLAKSVLKLQDPDMREEYLATAAIKPSLLLKGETPRLLDEWQDIPMLWDAVRTMVDQRGMPGQFLLTGSNTIDRRKILHSGTGRIARLRMSPMSLWESLESNGGVSLLGLFDNPQSNIDGMSSNLTIEQLVFAACRGGWPASLHAHSDAAKLLIAKNYLESICDDDISRNDGKRRNPALARAILHSYARNISTPAKKSSILSDITMSGDFTCSMDTLDDYLNALARLFVVQDLEAWCPAVRSKTVIRSTMKRCFADPSIAVAAMGLSPRVLLEQLKTFGFIFEQMCIRDLKAYSAERGGHLSYYRDRYGLEADGILHLDDGRYALLEFKLGGREIEEGAAHLKKLETLIQQHNVGKAQVPLREPDLLMVVTGGQMAYSRPDGVKVVPLGCLRP
ncbi:MAG: ATP-binding protein [Victivallales bacterium]|nr:ATP-binding protein [Victivallales bacterium]